MTKSKKFFILHFVIWLVILAIYVAIIMYLWNWLVPAITGWSCINYLQALGLFFLVHLLSGTLMHRENHALTGRLMHDDERRYMDRRFMRHMSREQREEILRRMFAAERGNAPSGTKVEEGVPTKKESQGEEGKSNMKEDGKE